MQFSCWCEATKLSGMQKLVCSVNVVVYTDSIWARVEQ